jgi:hypothetical protein
MKRFWEPVIGLIAVIYFLVDAVFLPVAARISNWVGERWMFCRLRSWIVSLRPYPTLLLFAVPVALLEPVKPVAAYLAGTGHVGLGATVFVIGELLKLVLVERLFSISRDKLMSIPAFAWAYGKYRAAMDWVMSLEAWQNARRWTRIAQYRLRRIMRASQNSRRLSAQSR